LYCPYCGTNNTSQANFCSACGANLVEPTVPTTQQPPVNIITKLDYAGFWRRFVAFIIDSIVLRAAASILTLATKGSFFYTPSFSTGLPDLGTIMLDPTNILSIIIVWLYYTLMESSSKQATLGKMALGLIVTDMEGRRISLLRATGRHFGKIVSMMTIFIGFILAGITPRKQALHDMIAGCLVMVRK